jgi:hypothetical protein
MTAPVELIAAGVRPPIAGEVYSHDITNAVIVRAIPAAWQGQGVTWVVEGGSCKVAFGTSAAIATTATARATGTPPVNTVNAASGQHYGDGAVGYAEIRQALLLTHYAVIGSTTAGSIAFARSSYAPND